MVLNPPLSILSALRVSAFPTLPHQLMPLHLVVERDAADAEVFGGVRPREVIAAKRVLDDLPLRAPIAPQMGMKTRCPEFDTCFETISTELLQVLRHEPVEAFLARLCQLVEVVPLGSPLFELPNFFGKLRLIDRAERNLPRTGA